jgi:benzodiazapine receptor
MFVNNITDVLILFVVVLFVYGDYFFGSGNMMVMRKMYKDWYKDYRKKLWLPPRWLFPIMWAIMYLLIAIAFFVFFRNSYNGEPDYVVPTIALLFLFHMMANKQWSPTFIEARMTAMAMALCVVLVATAITILVIFGINANYVSWVPFATFLAPVLWYCFALTLNARVLYVEMSEEDDKKCSKI